AAHTGERPRRTRRQTRYRAALPSLEARQHLVEAALVLLVETGAHRLGRLVGPPTAPAPDAEGERQRTGEHAEDRQPPREQVEPLMGRRRENLLPVVRD